MKTLMGLGATGLLALGLVGAASQPAEAQRGTFRKEKQVNMQRALSNLQQARGDLQRASKDKGGHRARAIQLIDQAIREVRAGARYDARR